MMRSTVTAASTPMNVLMEPAEKTQGVESDEEGRQGSEVDRALGLRGAHDAEQWRHVEEEADRDDGAVPAKSNMRLIKPPSDVNTRHAARKNVTPTDTISVILAKQSASGRRGGHC
jgi:hypothetical protein